MSIAFIIKKESTIGSIIVLPSELNQSFDIEFKNFRIVYASNNSQYDLCISSKYKIMPNKQPDFINIKIKHDAYDIFKIENDTLIINLLNHQPSNSFEDVTIYRGIIKIKLTESELNRFSKWHSKHYNK
jgi:hypothetical protein